MENEIKEKLEKLEHTVQSKYHTLDSLRTQISERSSQLQELRSTSLSEYPVKFHIAEIARLNSENQLIIDKIQSCKNTIPLIRKATDEIIKEQASLVNLLILKFQDADNCIAELQQTHIQLNDYINLSSEQRRMAQCEVESLEFEYHQLVSSPKEDPRLRWMKAAADANLQECKQLEKTISELLQQRSQSKLKR